MVLAYLYVSEMDGTDDGMGEYILLLLNEEIRGGDGEEASTVLLEMGACSLPLRF